MNTAIEQSPQMETSQPSSEIEKPLLETKLHARWALAPWHLGLLGFWCFLFFVVNTFPLRETDLWGHVSYGNWILDNETLPVEDPFQPLSEGMKVLDSAWLSQILLASVERVGGTEALSTLFAVVTLGMYLFLAAAFFNQSRDLLITYGGTLAVLGIGWSRISTIRPENFGTLLFALLLWLIVSSGQSEPGTRIDDEDDRKTPWRLWIGIPLVMCLWANLHGSFVCGLALLACMFAGAVIEAAWRTRSLRGVVNDPDARRWLWLCELAVIATCINPYGIDLLLYVLIFSINTNLYEISEWQALELIDTGGPAFSVSVILLVVAFRHSRRRIPAAHIVLLLLFTVGVIRGVRMIWWYGAVWGIVVMPHFADIWSRIRPRWWRPMQRVRMSETRGWFGLPRGRAWCYTLVAGLLIWVTFALSPTGKPMLGDEPRAPEHIYSDTTPWQLTEYLRQNPPEGQVFNPQWWGDWLAWDGPSDMELFVTTNVHLLPKQVWRDYRVIRETRSGWANVMARYDMDTAILHKQRQTTLLSYLRISPDWRYVYEDDVAAVFRRVASGTPRGAEADIEVYVPEDSAEAQERSGTSAQ